MSSTISTFPLPIDPVFLPWMPAATQLPSLKVTTEQLTCPICGNAGVPHIAASCCTIRACHRCSHQWAPVSTSTRHLEENYSIGYFEGGGAGYSDYLAEGNMLRRHGRTYGQILAGIAPKQGTLLDVGAAAGFIAQGFSDTGWRTTALEPNREMIEYGRTRLGVRTHHGSLEENQLAESFDAVAMIQVLAHFIDPKAALQKAAQLTKPGGIWLIETWDSHSLMARVLGKHWHEYSPPSALHYFTKNSLKALAAEFGFEQVATGRPDKRIGIGHAMSLLSYQMGDPRWMRWAKNLPDSFTLPYPGDDIFWAAYRRKT